MSKEDPAYNQYGYTATCDYMVKGGSYGVQSPQVDQNHARGTDDRYAQEHRDERGGKRCPGFKKYIRPSNPNGRDSRDRRIPHPHKHFRFQEQTQEHGYTLYG